jgi:hypothetical protein
MRFAIASFTFVVALSCSVASAADYYFNSAGNDGNDGRSTATAWKTTTNATTFSFADGDRLLFAGGQTFAGGMLVDTKSGGTPANPLVITSYGSGRATIDGQTTNAITIKNRAGIIISNIIAIGAGASDNTGDGIAFYSTVGGKAQLPLIIVDHVEASGFGGAGICVVSWKGPSGFRDVWILNSATHDNGTAGLLTYAEQPNTHSNLYIGVCSAYNNSGDSKRQGSGIVLGEVAHATIEWCVSHDNGQFAGNQGPVGIWTYDSSDVTMQFNEAYSNRELPGYDGGGFDLDYNTKNSVAQYNYSHDNNGPGFMTCCSGTTTSNVIRYNISQDDCRAVHDGALHSFSGDRIDMYNNSIYLSPSAAHPAALMLVGPTSNIHIHNNIFQTTGGAPLVAITYEQTGLSLVGNDYWSSGGAFNIMDSNVTYTNLTTWRAQTGRETLNGKAFGLTVNPQFMAPGAGQTLNDATLLRTVTAYNLHGTSPLIDAGLDLRALFAIDPGPRDFKGTAVPQGKGYDMGANEVIWNSMLQFSAIRWNAGQATLSIVGPLQRTNVLENSSDSVTWHALYTWVNSDGTTNIIDANASDSNRFYRARELP